MPSAPTRNPQQQNAQQAVMPIPFPRAARRKNIQAFTYTTTIAAGSTTNLPPIELPAAGFIRDLEMYFTITSAGNGATVANAAVNDLPFNLVNSIQVTNAAGDTIYVPINGYQLMLIQKYSGIYQPPFSDPRGDQAFVATTTGAAATAGTGAFMIRLPFEIDPRDAFCALPNLAANKAYQVIMNYASIAQMWQGGTAPNGTVTIGLTIVMNYWSQPNAANGDGIQQQTAPGGVGSVSLFRMQIVPNIGGGNKVQQLYNVGNVIRFAALTLYDNASPNKRDDTDWPAIMYFRLNNDQLFYKPVAFWLSGMRLAYGYGGAAAAKDVANGLDTGVYIISEFIQQHGSVEVDSPRDQYLVTLDSTLWQYEAANFGANANNMFVLTNEIKPIDASALYSLNIS